MSSEGVCQWSLALVTRRVRKENYEWLVMMLTSIAPNAADSACFENFILNICDCVRVVILLCRFKYVRAIHIR